LDKWKQLLYNNASMYEKINQARFIDYVKEAQKVILSEDKEI
jgi:hypothetical protein